MQQTYGKLCLPIYILQAVRGTQRGARFLHEGRVEEAIREFHSVCNRVPRRFR